MAVFYGHFAKALVKLLKWTKMVDFGSKFKNVQNIRKTARIMV